jgi:hypothetical protein
MPAGSVSRLETTVVILGEARRPKDLCDYREILRFAQNDMRANAGF